MPLIATHSLNENNLEKVLDINCLVMPSIAIFNASTDFDNFGKFCFVLKPESYNPKDKKNIIYNRDMYSVRFPEPSYDSDNKKINDFMSSVDKIIENDLNHSYFKNPEYVLTKLINNKNVQYYFLKLENIDIEIPYKEVDNSNPLFKHGTIKEFIKKHPELNSKNQGLFESLSHSIELYEKELNAQYSSDIVAILIDPYKQIIQNNQVNYRNQELISLYYKYDEGAKNIIDQEEFKKRIETVLNQTEYQQFIKKIIKDIYSNPHFKINNRKVPYTPENILKIMKRSDTLGSEGFSSLNSNSISAHYSNQITSMKSLFEESFLLSNKIDIEKEKQENDKKLFNLHESLYPYYIHDRFSNASESLAEILKSSYNKDSLLKNFEKNYYEVSKIPPELIKKALSIIEDLKLAKTEYFEGKLKRIVDFSELECILVPKDTNPLLIKKLKEKNIHIEYYSSIKEKVEIYSKYHITESQSKKAKLKL